MEQLIPIGKSKSGRDIVSARALHQYLEVGTRFDIWFARRLEEYSFVQDVDFYLVDNGQNIDYFLPLSTAKDLAARQRGSKGMNLLHFIGQRLSHDFTSPPLADSVLEYRALVAAEKVKAATKARKERRRGTYFLMCKEVNAVKIGMSWDVKKRIKQIQAHNPCPIELLLFLPFNIERELHARFSHLQIHLEWFRLDGEILSFIDDVKSGVLLAEFL